MRVRVRVTPRAKQRGIEAASDGTLRIKVTEPAEGGRANAAMIKLLAEHFHILKRAVVILQGEKSRQKLVGIDSTVRTFCR